MVEHRLPKPGVEGSNPFSRSIFLKLEALVMIVEMRYCRGFLMILNLRTFVLFCGFLLGNLHSKNMEVKIY